MENLQHHLEYIHEVEGVSFVHSMNHLILESMLEHVWISLSLQDFYMISRESESPHVLVKEASKTKSSKCFIHKKRRSKTKKKDCDGVEAKKTRREVIYIPSILQHKYSRRLQRNWRWKRNQKSRGFLP